MDWVRRFLEDTATPEYFPVEVISLSHASKLIQVFPSHEGGNLEIQPVSFLEPSKISEV